MWRPHRGHEQRPVVRLQGGRRVQFMERPRRPIRLGLGVGPALGRVRVSVWVGVTVGVLQARVQTCRVRVHGIGGGAHVTVGATLGRRVVAVPEGRREVPPAS